MCACTGFTVVFFFASGGELILRVLTANKHPQSQTTAHNYIKGDEQDTCRR